MGRPALIFVLALVLPVSVRPQSLGELVAAGAFAITLACLYPVIAVVVRPKPPTFEQNYHAAVRARTGR